MVHTEKHSHQCTTCGKGYNSFSALKTHERSHTGEKPYKCEFCKMGFTQNGNLRAHIRRVHSIEVSNVSICMFDEIESMAYHIFF